MASPAMTFSAERMSCISALLLRDLGFSCVGVKMPLDLDERNGGEGCRDRMKGGGRGQKT